MTAVSHECAGWFGKIPSVGDFLTRGLPRSFIEPWDEWLSFELSQAERAVGERWPQTYARASVSCFVLGPRVIDARLWCGVLVPSFDRVGRQFPLTIAFGSTSHVRAAGGRQWWSQLARAGRRAAAPGGTPVLLEEALAGLIRAEAARGPAWDQEGSDSGAGSPGEGLSSWWPVEEQGGSERAARVIAGLPRSELFVELLTVR